MHKLVLIYNALFNAYGPQLWWPATGENRVYEIMVGAILTQNTAWTNVEKAIKNLKLERLVDPQKMGKAQTDLIAEAIKPSGYYNQKALKLKALSSYLEKYMYDLCYLARKDIEELRAELLSIWGIGEETADSILLYALDKASFVVDAYTRRIFGRIGLIEDTWSYMRIKEYFESNLPRNSQMYNEYHALIVAHAKAVCRKLPLCKECPVKRLCKYAKN